MHLEPYQIHPVLIHFPIALLSVAAVFEWGMPLVAKGPRERWLWVATCLLWTGTVFAGFAVASGLWAQSTVPAIPSAYDTVGLHKKLGIAVGILGLVLSVWRIFRRPPVRPWPVALYGLLWIALLAAVGLAGFYGGRLVFDFGVGVTTAG